MSDQNQPVTDASTTGAVERFSPVDIHERNANMLFEPDGEWVRFTDYQAAIQRAEAAQTAYRDMLRQAEADLTEARAQAALAWEAAAGIADDTDPSIWLYHTGNRARYGESEAAKAIRSAVPADLSAALAARLDAELDRVVHALEADAKNGDISEGALQWCLDTIRALRRAAPTEGEA